MAENELVKRLTEQRNRIYEEIKGITDAAASEGRDLSADEAARFDKGSKDMDELRGRVEKIADVERMNREAQENLRKLGVGSSEDRKPEGDGVETELRSFLRGERREWALPVIRGAYEKRAALVTSTATAAGDLVPTSMYDRIVYHMVQTSGVLQAGPTVIQTTGGENLDVPTTTSYGAAAAATEGSTLAGTNPAVTKRTLSAYKYGQLVQVSKELIDDSAFDIAGFVARAAGIAIGLAVGTQFVTGSGTSAPAGIVTNATLGKTGATGATGAFTGDDLIDLFFSVTAPYRNSPNVAWLCKDATLGEIRKLKDGSNRYLFSPAATVGAPDTLLGKPIYTDPNVAGIGLGGKSVIFGDIAAYYVRYAGGVRFERSDDFAFDKDLVTFRSVVRADGVLVDQTGAVKYFAGGAS